MAYPDNQYMQNAILYIANDAIVTDAIAPVVAKPGTCQRFAEATRVSMWCNLLIHVVEDAPRRSFVQLCQLTLRLTGIVNLPGQDFS